MHNKGIRDKKISIRLKAEIQKIYIYKNINARDGAVKAAVTFIAKK